jgi:hypothetical protein
VTLTEYWPREIADAIQFLIDSVVKQASQGCVAKTILSAKPNQPPISSVDYSTLANVRFVDPPGAVGWFQFPPAPWVQFGCVALHPAPNGGVISGETSFHKQFLDVLIRKREPQIPTDRANHNLGFEVPPFEQRRPRFNHGIYCSLSDSFTEFLQHSQ